MDDKILEVDLNQIIPEVDDELLAEGVLPFQRPLEACKRIADRLGVCFQIGGRPDPLVEAVHSAYGDLYRRSDLVMPPLHVGVVMFRDVFVALRVPLIYGAPRINPADLLLDLSAVQRGWLFHNREDALRFYDQWIDLFDFVLGFQDRPQLPNNQAKAYEFWGIAKRQLEGAAATLIGSFDQQSVIQNSCIAVELLLKGALLTLGETEERLKSRFGHKLPRLAEELSDRLPSVDRERLKLVVEGMPELVASRYDGARKSRIELGHIVMGAQFVAGEMLRQFTERNHRSGCGGDPEWDLSRRSYPALRAEVLR